MVIVSRKMSYPLAAILISLMVMAIVSAQYNYSVHILSKGTIYYQLKAYRSELRGVLVKHPALYPHNDSLICQTLAQYNFNAIYFQVNPFYYTGLDMSHFQDMIDACTKFRLEFHVLVTVGFGTGPDYLDAHEWDWNHFPYGFTGYREEWCTYDNTGALTKYPSYCSQAARDRLKQVIQTMLTFYPDIKSISLDYIRYQDADGINFKIPYDEASKNCFLEWLAASGKMFTGNWSDYYYGGSKWREFAQWRATTVDKIVEDVRKWAKEIKPSIMVAACTYTPWLGTWYPDSLIESIGQNTPYWISQGYIDAVNPMNYVQTLFEMQDRVNKEKRYWLGADQHSSGKGAIPLVPFITSGGSGTGGKVDIEVFIQQINFLRESGCNGFIIYQYDGPGYETGWNNIVPYLAAIKYNTTKGAFPTFIQTEPIVKGSTISWQTSLPTIGSIEYSASPLFVATTYSGEKADTVDIDYVNGTVITNSTKTTHHTFTVPISPPFYYRIINKDDYIELASPVYTGTG